MMDNFRAVFNTLEKIISLLLVAIFAYKVYGCAERFGKDEVGTSFTKVVSSSLLYPSMTMCFAPLSGRKLNPFEGKPIPDTPDLSRLYLLKMAQFVDRNASRGMMHKASNIRGEAELREFGVVPHLALHARTNSNKSSVLECFTVNPKHESPTGLRGRVRLNVDMTDVGTVTFYVHNKEELFVPNNNHAFGSALMTIIKPHNGSIFTVKVNLRKTEEQAIDKLSARCRPEESMKGEKSLSLTQCLTNFIETGAKCRTNMYGSDQKKPICRTTEQLKKVVLIAEKLREMTENEVFEKTGCLSSCNKAEYSLTPIKESTGGAMDSTPNTLRLRAWFPSGRYLVRREYVLYDPDSFIADIGGYLGLLLGHSLLSLFHSAGEWFVKK